MSAHADAVLAHLSRLCRHAPQTTRSSRAVSRPLTLSAASGTSAHLSKGIPQGKTRCLERLNNQVADYVYLEKRINIAVGDGRPSDYFPEALYACEAGERYSGDISDVDLLEKNFEANCIPFDIFETGTEDYEMFLEERRRLMAEKVRGYLLGLEGFFFDRERGDIVAVSFDISRWLVSETVSDDLVLIRGCLVLPCRLPCSCDRLSKRPS